MAERPQYCGGCGLSTGLCVATGGAIGCEKVVDKCIPCIRETSQQLANREFENALENLLKFLLSLLGGVGSAVVIAKILELVLGNQKSK